MNKYLNENGLNKFWKRIKEKLDTKASKDDIKLHYTQARLYYTDSINSEVVPPGTNLSMLPLENDSDYFQYNKTELIFKKTGTYEISANAFCENVGNCGYVWFIVVKNGNFIGTSIVSTDRHFITAAIPVFIEKMNAGEKITLLWDTAGADGILLRPTASWITVRKLD